jgi:hypothetical protein
MYLRQTSNDREQRPTGDIMRSLMLASLAMIVSVAPTLADPQNTELPRIVIGGDAPAETSVDRCVEVEIGGNRAYNCINDKLRRQVDRINPSANVPPIDARSADIKVGVVSIPGVQQQYGKNFGNSVVPYRPPPPVFTSPFGAQ